MPTLLELLMVLAEETGDYASLSTTTLGTTSTLISSALVNSNLSASAYEGASVLLEDGNNAGEQRAVRRNGLTNTTGTLTLADAFTNVVESGVTASIYGRLPALSRLAGPSYQKAIDQAHRRAWIEDTISFTGVTDQKRYAIDTATYPWWTTPDRIIAVYYPQAAADDALRTVPPNQWDWNSDGAVRQLVFSAAPWKTGETGLVNVYRPANSLLRLDATAQATVAAGAVTAVTVRTGGYYTVAPTVTFSGGGGSGATATATLTNGAVTSIAVTGGGTLYTTAPAVSLSAGGWKDQTTQSAGMLALSDESLMTVNDVAVLGAYYVYKQLATLHAPGQHVGEWMAKAAQAAMAARRLTCLNPQQTRLPNLRPTTVGYRTVGYR